jgi:hypothetical protein
VRRVHGALFSDAGEAFSGALKLKDVRYSVGAELRVQATLIYYVAAEIQLGIARGLSKGGSDQIYLVTSFPF